MILYLYFYNYFHHTWSKELPIDEDSAIILHPIRLERLEPLDQGLLFSMCKRELTDLDHLMIAVLVGKESTELLSSDHLLIRNSQRDKKPFLDLTEEFFVLDA